MDRVCEKEQVITSNVKIAALVHKVLEMIIQLFHNGFPTQPDSSLFNQNHGLEGRSKVKDISI